MKIIDLLVEYETHTYKDDKGNVWRVDDEGNKELVHAAPGGGGDRYPSRYNRYNRPRPQRSSGMYFFNVRPGQENDAIAAGLQQTKSGKWYSKYSNPAAEKMFGPGKWWEPKAEETTSGATSSSAVPTAPGKGRPDSIVV